KRDSPLSPGRSVYLDPGWRAAAVSLRGPLAGCRTGEGFSPSVAPRAPNLDPRSRCFARWPPGLVVCRRSLRSEPRRPARRSQRPFVGPAERSAPEVLTREQLYSLGGRLLAGGPTGPCRQP